MSSPSKSDIDARLTLALAAADTARGITLPAFDAGIAAANKGKGYYDPVTQADKDSETALRAAISSAFPHDAILGEEHSDTPGTSGWTWCLDPIDGTRGFVAGIPVWSTLIGVAFQGKPLVGVMDFPAINQRFTGAHGVAHKQDSTGQTRLKTRACPRINDAVLSCTEPFSMFSRGQLAAFEMIRRTARFTRLGLDAFGYALVASGRMDVVLEAGLKPYDIAAIIPVLEGAGGRITDWHGGPASKIGKDGGAVIGVGDPALADEIYPYLMRAMD